MAEIHQVVLDSNFAEVKRLLEAEPDCVNAKLEGERRSALAHRGLPG